MKIIIRTIPNIDETPISRHKKNDTTNVCIGPVHMYGKKYIEVSKRFTSFDNKFTTWPAVVSPKAVLLNRNA
jgi:hypothetical protein